MIHENSFAVSRFENRNSVISWRVAGWLHGVRIRKNFKSKEEAAAEKAVLELKALQIDAGLRTSATCLSEEQVREAESAFNRLKDRPKRAYESPRASLNCYRKFRFGPTINRCPLAGVMLVSLEPRTRASPTSSRCGPTCVSSVSAKQWRATRNRAEPG
jgi:hypothetical protein